MSGMLPVSCLSFPHLSGNVKALGWPFIADINLLTSWSRWNWDIYDRVHKNSLMGQYIEPAHTLLPCLSKICFYIIPAAEFGFRELYPSFKFSIEIFVRVSDLCYVGRRLSSGIWWRAVWSKFSSFWGNPLPPSSG